MKQNELTLLLDIVKEIRSDLAEVKKSIYGNGKIGIADRLGCVENEQKNILGRIGLITAFFGLVFTAMFEIVIRFFSKKVGME